MTPYIFLISFSSYVSLLDDDDDFIDQAANLSDDDNLLQNVLEMSARYCITFEFSLTPDSQLGS